MLLADAPPAAPGIPVWLLILTPALGAVGLIFGGSGVWALLASRRERREKRGTQSGSIAKSEASQLWEAMQSILAGERARADRAEERQDKAEAQRDKLIDSVGRIPAALEAIQQGLAELAEHSGRAGPSRPPPRHRDRPGEEEPRHR